MKLFVTAGQSNMGLWFVQDVAPDAGDAGFQLAAGAWLGPRTSPDNPALTRFENGPAMAFGRAVIAAGQTPIGVVGANIGGSLISQWQPGQAPYDDCLRLVRATGLPVAGVLVAQGEADANTLGRADGGVRRVSTWQLWFERFVQSFRADLADQTIPVVLVRLAHTPLAHRENWADIQAQQDAVRLSNFALVDSEPATVVDSDIHLDDASYAVVGQRMADAWLAIAT